MFQGPKVYIAQICEVHLQYGWKQYNKMAVLHFFSCKFHSNIYSVLFDRHPTILKVPYQYWPKESKLYSVRTAQTMPVDGKMKQYTNDQINKPIWRDVS